MAQIKNYLINKIIYFAELCASTGLPRAAVTLATFSNAIAKAAGEDWGGMIIAQAPNDAALLTLPMPSVPTSLTLNVMNAIYSPQILAPALAKQAAKPATLPPTWVWQLAFLLGLMGVLVVVAVGVLVSASPTLRFMLIALERAEVNTFLAFLRSLSSFFFGLFGLMGAIAAVTRTLLRQPSAWAGLLAGIAIVVAWVSAMVAIYRPMPKSAGFTPTSL